MNRSLTIGTAGHVDHGKTALVKKLTGVDTDKLKAEQKSGISIELGFAPLILPSGQKVSFVDVPGHEKFIKTMVAGIAGIDLVLLTIAADEGFMPQTFEHLAIIDLLNIKHGIIVITKADLAEKSLLDLVVQDIKQNTANSVLANAPIIVTSVKKDIGIADLITKIDSLSSNISSITNTKNNNFRLPIDQVFNITGFGSVVTGTIWSGSLTKADEIEFCSGSNKKNVRVRNLENHGQSINKAKVGQRVAINLAGIDHHHLKTGAWLAKPGLLEPSYRFDVNIALLKKADIAPLKNRAEIRFHHGSTECIAKLHLIDRDILNPGENCLAQVVFKNSLYALKDDKFIIRSLNPIMTIGGGSIVDPTSFKLKRHNNKSMAIIKAKSSTDLKTNIHAFLKYTYPYIFTFEKIKNKFNLNYNILEKSLNQLIIQNKIIKLEDNLKANIYYTTQEQLLNWQNILLDYLKKYHEKHFLRAGIKKEELKQKVFNNMLQKVFEILFSFFVNINVIIIKNDIISVPGFKPQFTAELKNWWQKTKASVSICNFKPLDWNFLSKDIIDKQLRKDLLTFLIAQKEIITINKEIIIIKETFLQAKKILKQYLVKHQNITLAQYRNLLNSNRNFALFMLEYFDEIKLTTKINDHRILTKH